MYGLTWSQMRILFLFLFTRPVSMTVSIYVRLKCTVYFMYRRLNVRVSERKKERVVGNSERARRQCWCISTLSGLAQNIICVYDYSLCRNKCEKQPHTVCCTNTHYLCSLLKLQAIYGRATVPSQSGRGRRNYIGVSCRVELTYNISW